MSGGFFSEENHVSCLLYFQIIFVHEVCEFAGFLGGYAAGGSFFVGVGYDDGAADEVKGILFEVAKQEGGD